MNMQQQPTQSSEEPTPDPEQGVKQKTPCSEAPPQGYAPPPQGYAPPPQGYAPPKPMMDGEPMNYPKTEEERTGSIARVVWPLAIVACVCAGLALIGFIPLFLACEFPIVHYLRKPSFF